jgi:hypothetical protein
MVHHIVRVQEDKELLLRLAQESLHFVRKEKDTFYFSDNGSFDAFVYFLDLCDANRKKLNKEHQQHLKR